MNSMETNVSSNKVQRRAPLSGNMYKSPDQLFTLVNNAQDIMQRYPLSYNMTDRVNNILI